MLLAGLLLVIVTDNLGRFLPPSLSHHVGNDSEGYLLALLLPAWIAWVRPRLARTRAEWPVTLAVAGLFFVLFLALYLDAGFYGKIRTLNETLFALAFLVPYVQLGRRPSTRVALLISGAVLGLALLAEATPLGTMVTVLAEGVVMLVIAPLLFDVTDRGILSPDRPSPMTWRVLGWVLLVAVPIGYIGLRHLHSSVAAIRLGADYGVRAQESFVGMFLIAMLYAVHQVAAARQRVTDRPTDGGGGQYR